MKRIGLLVLFAACVTGGFASSNNRFVNLFAGTSGDNGQVAPGATVPFGMICVCPDSDPRTHAGYDYAVPNISGISINRLSGVGCSGGGGNLRIRPALLSEKLLIDKSTEQASPGYYATSFTNDVAVELSATPTMALERYTFPKEKEAYFYIDFASTFENVATCSFRQTDSRTIEGWLKANTVCSHGAYRLFFVLQSDADFEFKKLSETTGELRPVDKKERTIELRISVSPIDMNQARVENDRYRERSFAALKKQAAREWSEKLGMFSVKGGTEDEKALFYTALYRVNLSPVDVTSFDGRYLGTDGKIYTADGFRYYSNWSLWDTFRTKFPFLVLTDPEAMRDMSVSLLHLYRTGKKDWATAFESTPTVRTEHAVILLLDAYRKGITDLDFRIGYDGMKKEMERLSMRSPDQKMESACDLWAMAQISGIVGEKEDSVMYATRSLTLFETVWKSEFMTVTPQFEVMRNNGLYQGTRWQYRWAAPQYLDKMIEWVGKETLRDQLVYFFEHHLYNQGNEPDIHVPFLFNRLGAPERSQQIVRKLLTEPMIHRYGGNAEFKTPYVGKAFKNEPEGYSPEMDEDDGTMSAWFLFGSMGLYPLTVGEPWYELVSPIFEKIEIDLSNGRRLSIQTKGRSDKNDPIDKIIFNGRELKDFRISHSELLEGGTLLFCY